MPVYEMYFYAKEGNVPVISPAVSFMPLYIMGSVAVRASPLQLTCCIEDYNGRKGQLLRKTRNTFTDDKDKGSDELKMVRCGGKVSKKTDKG